MALKTFQHGNVLLWRRVELAWMNENARGDEDGPGVVAIRVQHQPRYLVQSINDDAKVGLEVWNDIPASKQKHKHLHINALQTKKKEEQMNLLVLPLPLLKSYFIVPYQ